MVAKEEIARSNLENNSLNKEIIYLKQVYTNKFGNYYTLFWLVIKGTWKMWSGETSIRENTWRDKGG